MITVTVLYPKTDSSSFDYSYYVQKHIPLVHSTWGALGLERVDLLRGTAALDGGPPAFELIGSLVFSSMDKLQSALAHAGPILADIPNFTNVEPQVQINETVAV